MQERKANIDKKCIELLGESLRLSEFHLEEGCICPLNDHTHDSNVWNAIGWAAIVEWQFFQHLFANKWIVTMGNAGNLQREQVQKCIANQVWVDMASSTCTNLFHW